ncbi:HesB/IscA family protein [Cereibacter azotoformans]|uniref:HesB/IscA family protein n=1 Tax=Cereibacter TaxID=1653176 RepID=UPI0011A7FC52|nr:iron-sulfur cluster assembly accessory protein [Cereibacter sediminicola]
MIQITPAAQAAIRGAIEGSGQPVIGLRLMVQSGGCAGLKYGMSLELKEAEDDLVVEAEGVRVLIDPQSGEYLKGATIDFVTSIEGTGFVFDNPNAKGGCGCGKSFC